MGYKRLYKNLIDIIKEEQAKLGFRRESIRLYYPLSSLNHFFDTQDTEEQMKIIMRHFICTILLSEGLVKLPKRNLKKQ